MRSLWRHTYIIPSNSLNVEIISQLIVINESGLGARSGGAVPRPESGALCPKRPADTLRIS